jgi:hypothetical protein
MNDPSPKKTFKQDEMIPLDGRDAAGVISVVAVVDTGSVVVDVAVVVVVVVVVVVTEDDEVAADFG